MEKHILGGADHLIDILEQHPLNLWAALHPDPIRPAQPPK